MPSLQPDPTSAIQVAPRPGPWILWEPPRASARREGLLFTVQACANPDCQAADVTLDVHPIDTGLASVEWTGKELRLSWTSRAHPERKSPVSCTLDVSRGTVATAEHSAYAEDVTERLRRLVRPEVLDRLHDELCVARGLPQGMWDHLPDDWQPGDLVAWADLWKTVRLDFVEAGGRTWIAIDHHCPRPGCDCRDTLIDFQRFDSERREAQEALGLVIVNPDGKWDLRPATKEGLVLREAWGALSELFGDVPRELERRREIVRKNVGALVLDAERSVNPTRAGAAGLPGANAPAGGSRVGRNDPCPCGSGRKLKRCCGVPA